MSKASAPCSSCRATPPAVSAEKPKAAKNKIVLELDDELSTKSDGIIKIKNIKKFSNVDLKQVTIVGHVQNFTKLSTSPDKSHHKLNFIIQDKKTNEISRMEIDILLDLNTKKEVADAALAGYYLVSIFVGERGFIKNTVNYVGVGSSGNVIANGALITLVFVNPNFGNPNFGNPNFGNPLHR